MKKKVGLIRKPKSQQRSKIRVPGLNNSKIIKSSNIKKGATDILTGLFALACKWDFSHL